MDHRLAGLAAARGLSGPHGRDIGEGAEAGASGGWWLVEARDLYGVAESAVSPEVAVEDLLEEAAGTASGRL